VLAVSGVTVEVLRQVVPGAVDAVSTSAEIVDNLKIAPVNTATTATAVIPNTKLF